jgi:hypothetical protein
MSQSIIYGLNSATLHPRNGFKLSRGPDGSYKGSMSFSCLTSEWSSSSVLNLLKKGTGLSQLYVELPSKFDFLVVDTFDVEEMPGGWSMVSITFVGQPDSTGTVGNDLDDENASVSYTRTTAIQQMSIFDHPGFKQEVTEADRRLFREWSEGLIQESPSDNADIFDMVYVKNDQPRGSFSDSAGVTKWRSIIIDEKILTWESPVSEWTKTGSQKTIFSQAELDKVGQAPVTPPLNPPAPKGQTWRYTGINEDITMVGVSEDQVASNQYSQTWSSGFWNSALFNHEDFGIIS